MGHIADLVSAGYRPRRHGEPDVQLAHRSVAFAARIDGRDELGRYEVGVGTAGDELGGVLWPAKAAATPPAPEPRPRAPLPPRDLPLWGDAIPAVLTTAAAAERRGGPARGLALPLGDERLEDDARFLPLEVVAPTALPAGTRGVVVAATHEHRQVAVFLPTDQQRLVAVNWAGDPALASVVYDLDADDKPDPERAARLHSMMRVVRPAGVCRLTGEDLHPVADSHALAWQLAPAGRDALPGGGLVADLALGGPVAPPPERSLAPVGGTQQRTAPAAGQTGGTQQRGPPGGSQPRAAPAGPALVLAMASARHGGPLAVGWDDDRHELARSLDGEAINSLHLQTGALFLGGPGDGPLEFQARRYEPPPPAPLTTRVHLRWDPAMGLWRWLAEQTLAVIDPGDPGGPPGPPPKPPGGPPPPTTPPFWPVPPGSPGSPGSRDDDFQFPPTGRPRTGFSGPGGGGGTGVGTFVFPKPGPDSTDPYSGWTYYPTGPAAGDAGHNEEPGKYGGATYYPMGPPGGAATGTRPPTGEPGKRTKPGGAPPKPKPRPGRPRTGTPWRPRPGFDWRARDRADRHDPYAAATLPLAAPAVAFQAPIAATGQPDARRSPAGRGAAKFLAEGAVVARLGATAAAQAGAQARYATAPSRGRWRGGEANGTVTVFPPGVDEAAPGGAAATTSTSWNIGPGVTFGFGTPDAATGTVVSGWRTSRRATDGDLVTTAVNGSGAYDGTRENVTQNPFRIGPEDGSANATLYMGPVNAWSLTQDFGASQMRTSGMDLVIGGAAGRQLRLSAYDASTRSIIGGPTADLIMQAGQPEVGALHTQIWGGDATGVNRNGGDIVLSSGVPTGTGVRGGIQVGDTLPSGTSRLGFLGTAPIARPAAYTQTYATADRTHAARQASAITNIAGPYDATIEAMADPADAPASADALRDDLVAGYLASARRNIADLADQVERLRQDQIDTAAVLNSMLDDCQAYGLLA